MGKPLMETTSAKPKLTFSLAIGVAMAVIGSSFQYGYNISVVNAPADEIKDYFFGPHVTTEIINVTQDFNVTGDNGTIVTETREVSVENIVEDNDLKNKKNNMWAIAVAVFAFAGMVGSVLVGPVVNKFGRRGGLMVNNLLSFIAAIFLGISKPTGIYAFVIVGRFFIGIFAGLATGIVPMYIGEISPKEWRGAIGVLNQLLITIGILVAQLMGLSGALGNEYMWHFLLAFTAVPSVIQMLAIPLMPKSPRYLLIDQHKPEQAKKVLIKILGRDNVEAELNEMQQEAESEKQSGQMSIPQLFADRTVRWQLISILCFMAAQQLSGINAVFFYSNMIFDSAGIKPGSPQDLASVGVGVVNVIMTIISVAIIERAGRKSLMVYGFGMMIFWCIAMTVVLNLLELQLGSVVSYLSIACIIGYIIGFAIGPGPVPWLITAELFRQSARPAAFMVACLLNWFCNFLIGIGFPTVVSVTGPWVFVIFTVVCAAITMYLVIVIPETKGKTFQEINNLFAKRNGVPVSGNADDTSAMVPLKDMEHTNGEDV